MRGGRGGVTVMIPFCSTITNWLMRILKRKNIKVISRPPQTFIAPDEGPLWSAHPWGLQYTMLLWRSCVGQTGRIVAIMEAEHKHHLCLGSTDKSTVTMHGWNTGNILLILRQQLYCIDLRAGEKELFMNL